MKEKAPLCACACGKSVIRNTYSAGDHACPGIFYGNRNLIVSHIEKNRILHHS